MPVLTDFRPADANETAACWRLALERKVPCFMALSRDASRCWMRSRRLRVCRRART